MGPGASAHAALIHSFDSYFGGGSLSTPEALAVDQTTGDVYVLEHGSGCLSRFYGERGGPEALEPKEFPAAGTNKICGLDFREGPSAAQVAIDNSGTATEGNIYVNSPMRNGGIGATLGYDNAGNLETELSPTVIGDGLVYICGVTTDPEGNVYVAEHYAAIWKYKHNDPVTDADFEGGPYEGPVCSVARDSLGTKYNVFEPNGPLIRTPPEGAFGSVLREAAYAIGLDPSVNDIYVSEGSVITGISREGIEFEQFGSGDISESRGVAIDETNGTAYVSDTPNGRIAIYEGNPAYRLGVDIGGTGLGAVSADIPPIEDCGDEGQCAGYYAPSTVVLKATPQPHSKIDGWTGCDSVNVAGDECTVEINSEREVFATFTRLQQQVTASTTGTGTGSVSVANGLGAIQGCGDGGSCTGAYDEGSAILLYATPTGHSSFTGWSGACTSESNPCEVVVEGTPSVTAHFTSQHAVSVKKAGTGAGSVLSEPSGLTCGGVCVAYFTDGLSVTLHAIASGHSTFTGWSGEGCSGTDTCEVSIGSVTKNVTATFAHDLPAAVTDPGATFVGQHAGTVHGSVNPNGAKVTRCVIEYGTGTGYGAETPCAPSAVGNGTSSVPIGANLTELVPGTTYHYRLSATNVGGTAYGVDETFRTLDDTCDTNEALCPRPPTAQPERRVTCKKGQIRRKGRCVRKKRHRKRSHRRSSQGARK